MFLQVAQPNDEGKTRLWLYSELEALFPGVTFQTKNGGDWNRSDGQLRDFIVYREKDKNRTIGIRLDGYKDKRHTKIRLNRAYSEMSTSELEEKNMKAQLLRSVHYLDFSSMLFYYFFYFYF